MATDNSIVNPKRFNFERWLWVWYALTYISLAIALVYALILRPHSLVENVQILILSVLFAGWFWIPRLTHYETFVQNVPLLLGYLATGWFVWFFLARFEIMFLMLLSGLYSQVYGMPPLRWKLIGGFILTILTTWHQIAIMEFIPWWYLIMVGMIYIVAAMLAVFIHAIMDQSRERQRLIEELQTTRGDLAAAERLAGVLEERQRLAREIHDTLAQGFTSIIMHLEAIEAALGSDPAVVQKHLDQARNSARESLAEARRIVWALQPESLERSSLAEVLQRLAERWSEENHIPAGVIVTGAVRASLPEIEVTLLRVAQESLANIRKHAKASTVMLTLSYMDDLVALDVHDDGAGFDLDRALAQANGDHASGFGLRSMRERVEALDGTLSVESAPGEGTTVAVALPV